MTLLVVICARSAYAYAPFCDIRGMSDDAPPPTLPVADIRFEADRDVVVWTWCLGLQGEAMSESRTHTSGSNISGVEPQSLLDLGLVASPVLSHPLLGARHPAHWATNPTGPAGFPTSVYRPPR